jgi:hypothetical protein
MKRPTLIRLGEFAFLGALYCSVAFFCHERREANEHTLPSVTVPQPTTDTIVLPPVPIVTPEPVKQPAKQPEPPKQVEVKSVSQEIAVRSNDDLPPPQPKAQVKAQVAPKAVAPKTAPAPAQVQCQPQPQCQPVECKYRRWRRGR